MLKDHFQNAYVTRNLDKTLDVFRSLYGINDFLCVDPDIDVLTPEGMRHTSCRAAMGWADERLMIEIIEPGPGTLDIYSHFLPEDDSPRLHHVGMRSIDWNATHQQVAQLGAPIAMEHRMPEGLNFIYIDTRKTLGHYIEYIWALPEMWQYMGAPENFYAPMR